MTQARAIVVPLLVATLLASGCSAFGCGATQVRDGGLLDANRDGAPAGDRGRSDNGGGEQGTADSRPTDQGVSDRTLSPDGPRPPLCPSAYPPGFSLVTGTALHAQPSLPEPEVRKPFVDPTFGTCVVRLTSRSADLVADDATGLLNEYSRVQSVNADGSLILIQSTSATWYIYDGHTLARREKLPFQGAVEPRWDSSDPDVLYYNKDWRVFVRYHVAARRSETLRDFAADLPDWQPQYIYNKGEGSQSFDGRYFAFFVRDASSRDRGIFVYDLRDEPADRDGKPGEIISRYSVPQGPKSSIDNVSMSPSGKYVLAAFEYCEHSSPRGTFAKPCGAMVYPRDLKSAKGVARWIGHCDLAVDSGGREVIFMQVYDQDAVGMVDLETGQEEIFARFSFATISGVHFSGRASRRPGWGLVSYYTNNAATTSWMDHLVFAVELKPGGRIVQLAHHHSLVTSSGGYWAEPHASADQSFTRLFFTSAWGRAGSDKVDTYMIELPANWTERL